MDKRYRYLWVLVSVASILGPSSFAAPGGQSPAGDVAGFASAPDGSGLPGATISLKNLATGAVVRVVSGDRGLYRAKGLVPGTYEIRAELAGFEPAVVKEVEVSDSRPASVNFTMRPATMRETVTVIGRVPRASLESAPARESTARDVGEALSEVPGLWKVRKGGIANDVMLRGLLSQDLNVLIDGTRICGACPNNMDPAPFHVDFAEVDRVEIGKGPFDIKNQGSFGGIVNIITRQPARGFHTYANLAGGSSGYINPALTASYGSENFSGLGGFSYRHSDPYSDGSGKRFSEYGNFRPGLAGSDAFRVGTAWAKLSAKPRANHQAQLSFARQEADHVLYPYLMMDAVYDNGDRLNFGYNIDVPSGWVKGLQFQGYFSNVSHWMTDEFRTSSLDLPRSYSMGTKARTVTFGGKFETSLRNLVVGVEGFRRVWDAATELAGRGYTPQFSIPDVKTDSLGLYADYGVALSGALRLNLGARLDSVRSVADPSKANTNLYFAYHSATRTSATDTLPSASARLEYTPLPELAFSVGLGSIIRIPDARERFFALQRMGSDWVGNPGLEPSRNTGTDVGISYHGRGVSVESSFYWSRAADFVIVVNQPRENAVAGVMNTMARSYRNVDATIYGADADLAWSLSSRIFLTGGLSVVRGTQTPAAAAGIVSRNLAEMPPLSTRAGLRYDTGFLMLQAEGVFAGRQDRVDLDLLETATPGYAILNLKAGINFRQYTLRVGLDNLFDKSYFEFLSYQRDPFRSGVRVMEPGRTFYLSLSYRY